METRIRILLQSALILVALGIGVQVSAQPEVITEVPVNSTGFVTIGDLVYFTAGDELWRTDGTSSGTILLASGFVQPDFFTEFNGDAYFTNADNSELWTSDGTADGTMRLHASGNNELAILGQANGSLFFQAYDAAYGLELYKTDGTSGGTMMVRDINPGSAGGFMGHAAVTDNLLLFAADDGTNGRELWKSDGSSGGTVMVEDINPGPEDGFGDQVTVLSDNNLFYFGGTPPDSGTEPWVSDGTAGGTYLLHDYVSDWEAPLKLHYGIAHDGTVFFLASLMDGMGSIELWRTDGTPGSTQLIENVGYDPDNFHSFRIYNDKVYFFNDSDPTDYLWVTDGTPEGTEVIFDDTSGEGFYHYFDVVNNYLLFTGHTQGFPTSFYRSDGTAAGTQAFREFNVFTIPGDVIKRIGVTTVGDFAFFADHDGPTGGELPDDPADYFHLFQTDGFTAQSMRELFGVSTIGTNHITDFNGKVIFTTYDDRNGGTGPKQLWMYDPENSSEPEASFTLVNADTDEDIEEISDGEVIFVPLNTNINIRYNPVGTPGSVVFEHENTVVRRENQAPYTLAGDRSGDYFPWEEGTPGQHRVEATPYSESGGRGTAGETLVVNFEIRNDPGADECTASGTILREYWTGVRGSRVSDIHPNDEPTGTNQLSEFQGPTNAGTNYGARIRGYVCPPTTGEYVFWIASNDHSELWLSTDDNPTNKVRIAFVEGATNPQQWTKFPSQQSAPISLTAGERYYIEALHKQGVGSDHVAVGWRLPNGTMERPIAGSRLSPFNRDRPTIALLSPEEGDTFTEPATIIMEAEVSKPGDVDFDRVEFISNSEVIAEFTSPPFKYTWTDVPAGTYSVAAFVWNADGSVSTSGFVDITVNESTCVASGTITREYWGNVEGSHVYDIPLSTPPDEVSELTIFEGPSNVGTHYVARIRGYICPPMTGEYVFWIASNDHSALWINPEGDDRTNLIRIANLEGATGQRQWNKYASQQSAPIILEQGKRYYIEALHKQGVGSDHIAVGWQLPGGTFERPIPGSRLSPFDMNDAARMASVVEDESGKETLYSQIGIYPNPVERGVAELRMSGYEGISESVETQVEIMNLTGKVIYAERIRCGGDCGTYLMNINEQLLPGVYMVNMKTDGMRFSKRLLVK